MLHFFIFRKKIMGGGKLVSPCVPPSKSTPAFYLFSVIASFKWFWNISLFRNIQLMLVFLKNQFFVLWFLSEYFIYCVTIYDHNNQASDLWQQLELPSELESDLWDTVKWGRKWFIDFNAEQENTLTGSTILVIIFWHFLII